MNPNTSRGLLIAGLSANVLFLALALIDYSLSASKYIWPIFVGWAFLVILLVVLALLDAGVRVEVVRAMPAPAAPVVHHVPAHAPPQVVHVPAAPAPAPATPPAPKMELTQDHGPFTYNGYTLFTRQVELKGGGTRRIWFFSKRKPASGAPTAKPAGFHVGVNERTGLPFLKKGAGRDGEDLTPDVAHALRPQCSALTEDGKQCRNSARADSKYCASHFGYQPPAIAKAEAVRKDTRARVRDAPDTLPSVRKKAR